MGGARFSYEGIPRVPSQGGWGHNFRASILQGESVIRAKLFRAVKERG